MHEGVSNLATGWQFGLGMNAEGEGGLPCTRPSYTFDRAVGHVASLRVCSTAHANAEGPSLPQGSALAGADAAAMMTTITIPHQKACRQGWWTGKRAASLNRPGNLCMPC